MSLVGVLRCDQMFQAVSYDSSMKIETQFCLGKLPETFCLTRSITVLGGKFCSLRSFESTSEVDKYKTLAAVTNCCPSDCLYLTRQCHSPHLRTREQAECWPDKLCATPGTPHEKKYGC